MFINHRYSESSPSNAIRTALFAEGEGKTDGKGRRADTAPSGLERL
jgi:hypothetical protein